nr:M15 family metallopeptidase [Massilia sp. YMA4]
MWLLAIILYFVLACLVSWMILFPAGREFMLNGLGSTIRRLRRGAGELAQRRLREAEALRHSGSATATALGDFLRRHYLLCAGGIALLFLPPLLAIVLGSRSTLSGYETSTREVNTQVAELLQGEQLVPPPPLPPLVFAQAQAEVAQERPMLVTASRDWGMMHAEYTQRLLMVFKIMKEKHGYDMAILEGYRSPERQNRLAAMGASVTNAAAYQSWHQYGLAADCAFLRDGKLVITEKDPWAMRGYQLYGEVAESMGLTWGGRWKMMDFGHTELRLPGVMRRKE